MMSTIAYQAFTQQNLDCHRLFWTQPWPVRIHGIPWHQLIDADEFGLHLNAAHWKYGSFPKGLKIRKPGNYNCRTFKLTIILAMETGNPAVPDSLIGLVSNLCIAHMTNEPRISAKAYHIFVEHVLGTYNVIENLAQHRTLIHDTLTLHRASKVYKAMCQCSHHVICHTHTYHRMGLLSMW